MAAGAVRPPGRRPQARRNARLLVLRPGGDGGIYGAFESTVRRHGSRSSMSRWCSSIPSTIIRPASTATNAGAADRHRSRPVLCHRLHVVTEGTYDKEYVATHTYGFDEWADYVLGKTDGCPRHASGRSRSPASRLVRSARWRANGPKEKTYLAAGGLALGRRLPGSARQ
jgi:trimethylamine-N-oxide reductase (cytochrome c)